MRLTWQDERVLAVMAHPDDADLMCAGTLERAHMEGAEIAIVYLCMGDKGQPDPPLPTWPTFALPRPRKMLKPSAPDSFAASLTTAR